ncbi:hypothetical protein M9Y10_024568 [Tritrichomonas musculus]|uniref:Surface antigen BspA-like n=1 Tax=Tritrichomonas musculus TaxID=1915356 RepID=A0ABR2HD83_9EUKA
MSISHSKVNIEENLENQIKKCKIDKLIFALNEKEKTCCLIGNDNASGDIFIPKAITYKSQEFIIASINEGSFRDANEIRSIRFSADSEIRTIKKEAFESSSIEHISIPSSVSELEEGWANEAYELSRVTIDTANQHFKTFDGQLIIRKSDEKSDKFDYLIFACKKIKTVTIPPNVKIIGPSSFANSSIESVTIPKDVTQICESAFAFCRKLKSIQFSPDSKLEIIGKDSFTSTEISNIVIPSQVTEMGKNAFSFCGKLRKVEFSSLSKIQSIEKGAFFMSSIESLTIPSSIIEFKKGWCQKTPKLKKVTIIENKTRNVISIDDKLIVGKSSIQSDEYDVLIFANRDIKKITIPSSIRIIDPFSFAQSAIESIVVSAHVRQICENAFSSCNRIKNVEFQPGSELQIIEKGAFSSSSIQSISIPPNVTQISESVFLSCQQLKNVEFSSDSKLQIIDKEAFAFSSIESLSIPSCASEFRRGWAAGTPKLNRITIIQAKEKNVCYKDHLVIGKSDTKSDKYDVVIYADRNIKTIKIPEDVKRIESYGFSCSNIENISISKSVTEICENAFSYCKKLRHVEIPFDSELQTIEENTFTYSTIESLTVPSSIVEFKQGWCRDTPKLKKVAVISNNVQNVVCIDNKLIIGKSDVKSDNYDVLIFVNRYVKKVSIPSNIRIINSFAFYGSSIESILIPPHVVQICEAAFANCDKLQRVEIPSDSELQIIENDVFANSLINSIFIPQNIEQINENAFAFTQLSIIEFDSKKSIDFWKFDVMDETIFMIPHL